MIALMEELLRGDWVSEQAVIVRTIVATLRQK
jgi:hypothetical protein